MKFKAVLFDFDYTLGDATESIVAGFRHAFAKMGYPEPTEEAIRSTVGYGKISGERRTWSCGISQRKSSPHLLVLSK